MRGAWGILGVAVLAWALGGCQDLILPEEPSADPVSTFQFLWEEMDRHYSFFELKGIDWDSIREEYRASVNPDTTPEILFGILATMLATLQDGHVTMDAPFASFRFTGWYSPYPHNFDLNHIWYTELAQRARTPSGSIIYGSLRNNVGYIHVPTFTGSGWVREIDTALAALGGIDALVLDLRDNAGGSDSNARQVAGRFLRERALFRRIQYRNGPNHGDFSPLVDEYIEAAGPAQFQGPIALLTNRRTFSAAESFVLALRTNDRVTVVGDTTGGGTGNPIFREMPNGWTFTISRWIEWAPDGTTHEGRGLSPDIPAGIPSTLLGSVDLILQAALQHLYGEIWGDLAYPDGGSIGLEQKEASGG